MDPLGAKMINCRHTSLKEQSNMTICKECNHTRFFVRHSMHLLLVVNDQQKTLLYQLVRWIMIRPGH